MQKIMYIAKCYFMSIYHIAAKARKRERERERERERKDNWQLRGTRV